MKAYTNRRILSFVLSVVMIFTAIPITTFQVFAITEQQVDIVHDGKVIDSLSLAEDGEEILSADIKNISAKSYKWQICIDKENDSWVTIGDRRSKDCKINFALIKSNLVDNTAYLQCVVNDGEQEYKSNGIAVSVIFKVPTSVGYSPARSSDESPSANAVETEMPKAKSKVRAAALLPAAEEFHTHEITVKYVFSDGVTPAWEPERFNIQHGTSLSREVTLPVVVGYTPSYTPGSEIGGALNLENGTFSISVGDVSSNVEYTVVYNPGLTDYKIVHHLQNLDSEGYDSQPIVENKKGLTGTLVTGDLHKSGDPNSSNYDSRMIGFSHLAYRNLVIAADGKTTIHIYYNREYYVVDYVYPDGGYGVESIAVRFGTIIHSKNPTRPGWDFSGWRLIGCRTDKNSSNFAEPTAEQIDTYDLNKGSITVPSFDLRYTPIWIQGEASFTVVYWREAENTVYSSETTYEYWGSKTYGYDVLTDGSLRYNGDITTGTSITADSFIPDSNSVTFKDLPSDISLTVDKGVNIDEKHYFKYNQEMTESAAPDGIVVEGDGTSVLNVYYDRKEYTLKFYYAAEASNGNIYVSGRTNRFGTEAVGGGGFWGGGSADDVNDEVSLFDHAMGDSIRQVKTLPTFVDAERYTFGEDAGEDNYTYHFFTFKAKYGSNISELWPTTEDISTVEWYSGSNSTSGWSSNICTFSGWNGEYNTYYTFNADEENNGNETVKGQYRRLDHRVLWTPELEATSDDELYGNTVTYLAYWSNAASVGWGGDWPIPSLYRYNIYLECLLQHSANTTCEQCKNNMKTFTVNGTEKTYYRVAVYDVADNNDMTGEGNLLEQTTPAVYGFENVNDTNGKGPTEGVEYISLTAGDGEGNYDSAMYRSGYDLYYFYDREVYELKFNNNGTYLPNQAADGSYVDYLTVRYGVSLYREDPDAYNLNTIYDENGELLFYPNNLEKDGYEFRDWYYSPSFAADSEFTFSADTTMPAHDLEIYAYWALKEHSVNIYANETDADNKENPIYGNPVIILHGNTAPTPSDPQPLKNGDAFSGWYYKDETGHENRFFFSMPIRRNMHIYAKYQSNVAVEYTIYFAAMDGYDVNGNPIPKKDENGETIYVADPRVAWAVANTDVTVFAKSDNELYEEFRTGWFPEPVTQDLSLTVNGPNTIMFYYAEKESVPYRVEYVYDTDKPVCGYFDENGNAVLTGEAPLVKEVLDNKYTVVTENFVAVDGFLPDELQKRLILSSSAPEEGELVAEENVLVFVYSESTNQTLVQVIEYVETLIEGNYTELTNNTYQKEIPGDYTHMIRELAGFTLNGSKTQINNVSAEIENSATEIVEEMISGGLLIEVYYDRDEVDYIIRHEIVDADFNLIKLESEQKLRGMHGATVSDEANAYRGYTLVDKENKMFQQMTLTSEFAGENPNIILFQYVESFVNIQYKVVGDENVKQNWIDHNSDNVTAFSGSPFGSKSYSKDMTQTDSGIVYRFDGWYINETCTVKVDIDWISADNRIIPQKIDGIFTEATYYAKFVPDLANLTIRTEFITEQGVYSALEPAKTWLFHIKGTDDYTKDIDLTVTVHGKGSVTVVDLPIGDYEVEELTEWTWRYDMDTNPHIFTLTSEGRTETFVPRRNRVYWLDGHDYDVNIFDGDGHTR